MHMRSIHVCVLQREGFLNLLWLVAGLGPRYFKNEVHVPGKNFYRKAWFPFIEKTDVTHGNTARPGLGPGGGDRCVYISHSSHSTGYLLERLLKENNSSCRIISIRSSISYSNFILTVSFA